MAASGLAPVSAGKDQAGSQATGKKSSAANGTAALAGQPSEGPADDKAGDGTHNAVSVLQEYIQCCSDFSPHARILTWNFEQQLQEDSLLQFRATVSFVFNQVPHHFSGSWQTSKKKAQRDAAERVRRYLAKQGEEPTMLEGAQHAPQPASPPPAAAAAAPGSKGRQSLPEPARQELQKLFSESQGGRRGKGKAVEWEIEAKREAATGPEEFRALLLFHINAVPHHFAGAWCSSTDAALRDAAERVLWYFGLQGGFSSSVETSCRVAEGPLPQQLTSTAPGASAGAAVADGVGAGADPRAGVEEKTILMQVQNCLQKTFAKDTPAGEKVWVWTYEPSDEDPQVFRALAEVPAIKRTFYGDWCRGKKLAQRSACLVVKAYLDSGAVTSESQS